MPASTNDPVLTNLDVNFPSSDQNSVRAAQQNARQKRATRSHRGVLNILRFMESQRMGLDVFLHALFYGEASLRANYKAKSARFSLVHSELFAAVLRNIFQPPRTAAKGARAFDGSKVLYKIAMEQLERDLAAELDAFADILYMHPSDGLQHFCTSDDPETILRDISQVSSVKAPLLMRLLSTISAPAQDDAKLDCKIVQTILCQLSTRKNKYNCRFQSLIAIFCKAKGTATKVVNLLAQFGISKTYRWTTDAVRTLSALEMGRFSRRIENGGRFWALHDNIRITFKKETQRVNNQTHGDNGTSMTAVWLSDDGTSQILAGYRDLYQAKQLELQSCVSPPRFSCLDFFDTPPNTDLLIKSYIHCIVSVLLDCNEFSGYEHRNHLSLAPPLPIQQLPTGKAHRTRYHTMASLPIEESSYEGNLLVVSEYVKLLYGHQPSIQEKKSIASGGIPWVGDWLTHSRLNTLKCMRNNDRNSFDRLDWIIPLFGWFHLQMLLAETVLRTHRGSPSSFGFSRSIHHLGIKGLADDNKKPYYHHVDTLLDSEFKARFLGLWLWATGTRDLKEVRKFFDTRDGPDRILHYATEIFQKRACTTALKHLELSRKADDEPLCDAILMNRDLLLNHHLRSTVRKGDVGHLQLLIPSLCLTFKGSGNHNYAKMLLEYMQWSRYEAPDGIRHDLMLTNCWLVNPSGRANKFHGADLLQEHNNRHIKHVHAPMGVNATWDLINALTPAIPFFARAVELVETGFGLIHSSKHSLPEDKIDVSALMKLYTECHLFAYKKGRKRTSSKVKDVLTAGSDAVQNTKWISDFHRERSVYLDHTNTMEDYSAPNDIDPGPDIVTEGPEAEAEPESLEERRVPELDFWDDENSTDMYI